MARFLVLALMMAVLQGCASTSYTKRWHVHPDDMALFNQTTQTCNMLAGARNGEQLVDVCLQSAGFKLEVIQN